MELQHLLAIGCFVGTGIQTVIDVMAWRDRLARRGTEGSMDSTKVGFWRPALWIGSPVLLVAIGVFLWTYQPTPRVVEKVVEKQVTMPCPATKSGAATTKGAQSPAITGTDNPVTYGQPLPKKE